MFQYDTITCRTADLSEQLTAKGKQGWEVETCQLMSNQAGVFVLLKKEVLDVPVVVNPDISIEPNILSRKTMYAIDPLKKRPGRKPGSKNKAKDAKSKQD